MSLVLLPVLLIVSFFLSWAITRSLIPILISYGIVDHPEKRRSHKSSTPRGAGIALVFIYLICFPVFEYLAVGNFGYSRSIAQILPPIALVSFWDDLIGIKIPFRLLVQGLCSVLAIMWLVHPHLVLHDTLPIYLDLAIGSFALLTFLNVYNFMDGIDGISVSESIHVCLTILLLYFVRGDIMNNVGFVIPTILIILGWSIGFLCFNWSPAKIFLGDVGSISLGFLFGICLLTVASSSEHLFLSCVICCLYYVADGGITIMIRLAKGEAIWKPHLNHFFQKGLRKGMSHKSVVYKIIRCNLLLMILSVNALFYPVLSTILAVVVVTYTLLRLS